MSGASLNPPSSIPERPHAAGYTRPYNAAARLINNVMFTFCVCSALIGIALLLCITGYVAYKGFSNISVALFTHLPTDTPTGLRNAIAGTIILIALSSVVGVPFGILCGVYLCEFARDNFFSRTVRLLVDVLAGTPSIIVGVLGYQVLVLPWQPMTYFEHPHVGQWLLNLLIAFANAIISVRNGLFPSGFSAWAGALALAFMMVPIIARTTEEMLKLVPKAYREASCGTGASHSQTLFRVTLPAARAGVITGIMLAIARIAGETAPLYFTTWGSNLPVMDTASNNVWAQTAMLLAVVGVLAFFALLIKPRIAALTAGIGIPLVFVVGLVLWLCNASFHIPYPTAHTNEKFPTLTVAIFENATSAEPSWRDAAWGGMLVLVLLIAALNLAVRYVSRNRVGAAR